jgi:hypothetical protein
MMQTGRGVVVACGLLLSRGLAFATPQKAHPKNMDQHDNVHRLHSEIKKMSSSGQRIHHVTTRLMPIPPEYWSLRGIILTDKSP